MRSLPKAAANLPWLTGRLARGWGSTPFSLFATISLRSQGGDSPRVLMPISGCGYRENRRASAAITGYWSSLMKDTPASPDTPTMDELAALRAIAEGTAPHTGQEFFQSLVRHL